MIPGPPEYVSPVDEPGPHPHCPLPNLSIGVGASEVYAPEKGWPTTTCIWTNALAKFAADYPGVATYDIALDRVRFCVDDSTTVIYKVVERLGQTGQWLHCELAD